MRCRTVYTSVSGELWELIRALGGNTYVGEVAIHKRRASAVKVLQYNIALGVLLNQLRAISLGQGVHLALANIVDPRSAEVNSAAAGHGLAPRLAAYTVTSLEHNARQTSLEDIMGCTETGEASTNDNDIGGFLGGREGQWRGRLVGDGQDGVNLEQPRGNGQLWHGGEGHGRSVAGEERLDVAAVLGLRGVVVDNVDGQLGDVPDGRTSRDDDLAQVQQRQVNLRLVVAGDRAILGAAGLA